MLHHLHPPCMRTRDWNRAQVLQICPARCPTPPRESIVTIVNAHFVSASGKRSLSNRDRKAGVQDCTRLAGERGIVLGDFNIDNFDDYIRFAHGGAEKWRKMGHKKDWILTGVAFGRKSSPVNNKATNYKSDVHYPVAVRVTSNDEDNTIASQLAQETIDAMVGRAAEAMRTEKRSAPPRAAEAMRAEKRSAHAVSHGAPAAHSEGGASSSSSAWGPTPAPPPALGQDWISLEEASVTAAISLIAAVVVAHASHT